VCWRLNFLPWYDGLLEWVTEWVAWSIDDGRGHSLPLQRAEVNRHPPRWGFYIGGSNRRGSGLYPADYVGDVQPTLTWSTLLPREDYQGTRASISQRLDSLEKRIGGHVPSPKEIVQTCDDPLESTNDHEVLTSLKTTIQTTLLLLIHASINTCYIGWLDDKSLHYRLRLLDDPGPH